MQYIIIKNIEYLFYIIKNEAILANKVKELAGDHEKGGRRANHVIEREAMRKERETWAALGTKGGFGRNFSCYAANNFS
jgi:hypothetical protein